MEGMTEYERTHMTQNLDRLISLTRCNVPLRSILRANGILGDNDVQELSLDTRTPWRKSEILYNMLLQKNNKNTFPVLIAALTAACQTGAVCILREELQEKMARHPAKKPRIQKYINLPVGLEKFLKTEVESSSSRAKNVLVICTDHIDITLEKIQELKPEGLDGVWTEEKEALKRLTNDSTQVLAVKTSNTANFLEMVGPTLRKLVIITEERKDNVQKVLRNIPGLDWNNCTQVEEDELTWSDLSSQFAQEVMERTVLLQNKPVQLKSIPELFKTNDEKYIETKLSGKFLSSVINDESPEMFKNSISPSPPYYIPRRIRSHRRISKDIFKKKLPDTFKKEDIYLYRQMENHELTMFVGPSETGLERRTDTSGSQIKENSLTVQHILLERKDHFDEICSKTSAPVHWLQYENGGFTWIKSRGSTNSVQKLVDISEHQSFFSEDEFVAHLNSKNPVNRSNMPVCIADTPGTGKSFLLNSMANNLIREDERKIIMRSNMRGFIDYLNIELEYSPELQEPIIINVLSKLVCEQDNELAISLVQDGLKKGTLNVELLLDGYDEVDAHHFQLADDCLRFINENMMSVRLIVSTEKHLKSRLENLLQTVSFSIDPFTKFDEVTFLVKFWNSQQSNLNQPRLQKFATHYCNIFEDVTSEKAIFGTPLQYLLIAEVYQKRALTYSDPENVNNLEEMDQSPDEAELARITDLYGRLIQAKFERYRTRYNLESIDETMLVNAHVLESLKQLFPNNSNILKEGREIFEENAVERETLLRIGILEKSTEQSLRFYHRSVAEYFISVFAHNSLRDGKPAQFSKFFFSSILSTTRVELPFYDNLELDDLHLFASTFKFQQAVYFVNSKVSSLPPANYSHLSKQMSTSDRCDIAVALAHDDLVPLFRHLLQSNFFKEEEHFLLSRNFLVVAVLKSSVSMLEMLIEECPHVKSQLIGGPGSPRLFKDPLIMLHAAVKRGAYPIFQFLCYNKQFKSVVQQAHKAKFYHLLHASIEETWGLQDGKISQRIQIIRLLLKTNPLLIHQKNVMGATPLCCFNIHLSLLLELIKPEHRANLLQTSECDGKNLLHQVATYLTSEQFHELVTKIPAASLKLLLAAQDAECRRPIHYLLQHSDPLDQTLELLSKSGAELQDPSYLEVAIRHGRSCHCVNYLIRGGVKWLHLWKEKGSTPIHAAAKFGRMEIVQLFLSLGMKVDALDKDNNNVLFSAVQNITGSQLEVVNELLRIGADLTAVNKQKESVLHVAMREGELETVELLLDQGLLAELNTNDELGNTPLHKAIEWFRRERDFEIISLLVERGANVNISNKAHETPLSTMLNSSQVPNHLPTLALLVSHGGLVSKKVATLVLKAVVCESSDLEQNEYEQLANECVEKGGELQEKDKQGRNFLHLAAQKGCRRGVEFLHSRGLKPTSTDNKGNTPLHLLVINLQDRHARFEVAQCLINHDDSVLTALNRNGETPLSTLLNFSEDPADYDAQLVKLLQCPQQTARKIMELAVNGMDDSIMKFDEELAHTLISSGAGVGWKNEEVGALTWLHVAAKKGSIGAVMFFVDQGISPDVRDELGNTPSHYVMKNPWAMEVDRLRFFVQRGANIKAVNNAGEYIIHWAARYGRVAAVEFLLSQGFKVVSTDFGSRTTLHYCFIGRWCENQFRVTELLLSKHANVNAISARGDSVADLAIKAFQKCVHGKHRLLKTPVDSFKFVEVLKLMIDSGLDLMRKNAKGVPILHLLPSFLRPSQFHQVVEYLVLKGEEKALLQLDESSDNILQAAKKHFEVLDETLCLLESCGL